jgi:hypothetical protein
VPDVPGIPSAEGLPALPAAQLAARLAEAYRVIGELTMQVERLPAQEFHESVQAIYGGVGQHAGYIAHADPVDPSTGAQFDWDWGKWGEFVVPDWYSKGRSAETTALAATYSLWTDLHSVHDFVYTGLRRGALKRRYDWFEKTGRPGLVLWWVADGTIPTWQDGVSRLEYLQDHEPAAYAFTFDHPFTPEGTPTRLDGS